MVIRLGQLQRRTTRLGAFSVVEAVFSIVLVGGLLVVALDTLGASAIGQKGLARRTLAKMLALELMSEVMAKDYEDLNDPPSFGVEPSEVGGGRTKFDDVDDYVAWSESPPETAEGVKRNEHEGWRRTVSVQRVDPGNYQNIAMLDTGVRKITVRVLFQNDVLETLTALRWGKSSAAIASEPPAVDQ